MTTFWCHVPYYFPSFFFELALDLGDGRQGHYPYCAAGAILRPSLAFPPPSPQRRGGPGGGGWVCGVGRKLTSRKHRRLHPFFSLLFPSHEVQANLNRSTVDSAQHDLRHVVRRASCGREIPDRYSVEVSVCRNVGAG